MFNNVLLISKLQYAYCGVTYYKLCLYVFCFQKSACTQTLQFFQMCNSKTLTCNLYERNKSLDKAVENPHLGFSYLPSAITSCSIDSCQCIPGNRYNATSKDLRFGMSTNKGGVNVVLSRKQKVNHSTTLK